MSMPPVSKIRRERALRAAEGYLLLDMPSHALRELGTISDWPGSAFQFHKVRGEARRALQDHALAVVDLELALNGEPTDLDVLMSLAWCYKRTERLPQAIAAMQQAYRHHSEEPVVLYNLSCYYALSGDKGQALSWLGRALRMEPSLKKLIADETDFDPIRQDPDFIHFMALVRESR
jgi:Flp pilus assembly protein TadD